MHFKMFAKPTCLLVFCLLGLHSVLSHRVIRSPDKMEVDIPGTSIDRDSGEFQGNVEEEGNYWQEQYQDKESGGQEYVEQEREKNKEDFEDEKEHQESEQQQYHNEMNNTYHEDKEQLETHHNSNQQHYQYENNYDLQEGNKTGEDLQQSEVGDRYGDKGTDYVNDKEDQMQSYDVQGNAPAFSYTQG